ncbi:RING/U-box superfamily protein [Euphorbia peplus]|nr:RING/U-box superfamily protein [Euphorbia peplus]
MASDGDDSYSYDGDCNGDYCFDDPNCSDHEDYLPDILHLQSEKLYTVLHEDQIKQRQNDAVTELSSVLSLPRKASTILLCSFKWTVSDVLDKWFSNEDQVRKVIIDQDLIDSLKELPDEHESKYEQFLVQSYVEQSRTRKWCPGNGCKKVIEFVDVCQKNWEVVCDCSLKFCWNCGVETHSPVDCDKFLEWLNKEKNEAENARWILAYTKPCPKCKNLIEKNEGCDEHMTCRRCGYQFCWLCLNDWHFYEPCNQSMLYRYAHYFESWKDNELYRRIARADLETFRSVHKEKLSNTYGEQSMSGIEEAWVQIIECRRALMWSYVYGYHIPENERGKKILFEDLQEQAESALTRLHECAEEDLKPFIRGNAAGLEFSAYHCELVTSKKAAIIESYSQLRDKLDATASISRENGEVLSEIYKLLPAC